ncbi:uncharacterized protein LOC141527851 [Cotesia typhae]|uniref:uncharacterized protein LOC141527851 n=1 Tax=Cotesia typhae TaxID=2053667 RepID=UPI003D68EB18
MENFNSRENVEKLQLQEQKLTEELKNLQKNLTILRDEQVSLANSNWKMEMSLQYLQKENKYLEEEVQKKNESIVEIENHYQQYKSENDKELRDFSEFFDNETNHYCNLLSNAKEEYDPENLRADIENYKRQTAILKRDLQKIESDINELARKFGLTELGTNQKVKLVDKIKLIIKSIENDESAVQSAIKIYKNKIRDLSKKIEHKEQLLSAVTKKNF